MSIIKRGAFWAAAAFTAIGLCGGFLYAARGLVDDAQAMSYTLEQRVEALEQQVADLQEGQGPPGGGLQHPGLPAPARANADPIADFLDKDDAAPGGLTPTGNYTPTWQATHTEGARTHIVLKIAYDNGYVIQVDDYVSTVDWKSDEAKVAAPLIKRLIDIRTAETAEAGARVRKALPVEERVVTESDKATVDAKLAEIAAELEAARVAK